MLLIGIFGLIIILILWFLLYWFFIKRADKFMDAWEKEMKEKVQKAMTESIKSLKEASVVIKTLTKSTESLNEALEIIKILNKDFEKDEKDTAI